MPLIVTRGDTRTTPAQSRADHGLHTSRRHPAAHHAVGTVAILLLAGLVMAATQATPESPRTRSLPPRCCPPATQPGHPGARLGGTRRSRRGAFAAAAEIRAP
ncbi:MAG TPA: hypothetical protein VH307_04125, partial [Streptosporangiaceae bacterium]|nr:hypothetical protein [Streptosporangiaceae bacterium]